MLSEAYLVVVRCNVIAMGCCVANESGAEGHTTFQWVCNYEVSCTHRSILLLCTVFSPHYTTEVHLWSEQELHVCEHFVLRVFQKSGYHVLKSNR